MILSEERIDHLVDECLQGVCQSSIEAAIRETAEACAKIAEQATGRQRAMTAAVNAKPVSRCEIAEAIRRAARAN